MKKILVTGTGGDVASGIIKCILAEMPQVVLYSCDIKPIVPYLDCFKEHIIVPRYDNDNYWNVIQNVCLEYNLTHFFPTTEPEILIADMHRDFFSKNNILLIINNKQILDIATSKYRTAVLLNENNICVPDTYIVNNLPESLAYPFIVKPDFGRGSAHLMKVNNQQELDNALAIVSSPVIQKYIGSEDQEFTVGVFSGGQDIRSISFRRKLGRGSMSVLVEVVQDPLLHDIACKVAKLFRLKGSINIQLRYHEGQYYIFEINPRISSTVVFRHMLGFKDVIWWLQILNNEPIEDVHYIDAGIIGLKTSSEQVFYPPFNIQDRS